MLIYSENEAGAQIAGCLRVLEGVLGQDLLGVYLYGSSIVGGLQKYSDIDLFVVSNRPTTRNEKTQLTAEMLTISRNYSAMLAELGSAGVDQDSSQRPIDMTIVVESEINPWHYPPTFDFQYGDWLREEFENGNTEPWSTKVMPDLAVLITQVLLASKTLMGPAPNQLLGPVPYHDFMLATAQELEGLAANLTGDARNVLLTLARIWSTVETDAIHSKPDAADWVLARLPIGCLPVLQRARAIYLGEEHEHWNDMEGSVAPCADFMESRIRERLSLLGSTTGTHRSIRIARQR